MISSKNTHQNIARKETNGKICGSFVRSEIWGKKGFPPINIKKQIDNQKDGNVFCPKHLQRQE